MTKDSKETKTPMRNVAAGFGDDEEAEMMEILKKEFHLDEIEGIKVEGAYVITREGKSIHIVDWLAIED